MEFYHECVLYRPFTFNAIMVCCKIDLKLWPIWVVVVQNIIQWKRVSFIFRCPYCFTFDLSQILSKIKNQVCLECDYTERSFHIVLDFSMLTASLHFSHNQVSDFTSTLLTFTLNSSRKNLWVSYDEFQTRTVWDWINLSRRSISVIRFHSRRTTCKRFCTIIPKPN